MAIRPCAGAIDGSLDADTGTTACPYGRGSDVNRHGVAVGNLAVPHTVLRAFVAHGTRVTPLAVPAGVIWTNGRPRVLTGTETPVAVNAAGRSAGGVRGIAAVWPTPASAQVTLPPLQGAGLFSLATAVTADGRVGGQSADATTFRELAVVWSCT